MRGVIVQPSFLPWRGFFDLIYRSDVFVFLDDVQYDKRSWRNRNRIKTSRGLQWITTPVDTKGKFTQKIDQTRITNSFPWKKQMLNAIHHSYRRSPYFDLYYPEITRGLEKDWQYLADLDIGLTWTIMGLLGLERPLLRSGELGIETEDKNLRLIQICQKTGITHYLSGPSAKDYMNKSLFKDHDIGVEYMAYDYPPYEQLHGVFEPQVSVIDLLFMKGPESDRFIWGKK